MATPGSPIRRRTRLHRQRMPRSGAARETLMPVARHRKLIIHLATGALSRIVFPSWSGLGSPVHPPPRFRPNSADAQKY
jgi:hypothetical protein